MPPIARDRWLHLGPLLDQALDVPVGERAAWLAALRTRAPDDADALEHLLTVDGTSWLGTTHRSRILGRMAATPVGEGARLGAWQLERQLGRGGMGTVWLAARADGRFAGQAAVKLLHPSLIEGVGEDYFRREGEVLARLTHPGIARLYDAGVTDEGQPYLVLEYVEGRSLTAWCRERTPTLDARLALFERVCDAVAHAHAHGIVHRDIKPANLAVGSDGAVKLLDFGIAVLVEEGRLDAPTWSGAEARPERDPGHANGAGASGSSSSDSLQPFTPRYAAPEQLAGGAITTATDVYALGRLLEELLEGVPDAPRDLQAIVRRALQREPADRYPTVAALSDELRRFRRHEPVEARAGGAWYRARRFARRHRGGLGAATVAVAALLVGTVVSVLQAREARAQRDLALANERRARVMSEVMLSLATELPTADADARTVDALRRTRVLLDAYLADDRAERARLAIDLARQFGIFARGTEAEALLADARTDAIAAGDRALELELECLLGAGGDTLPPEVAWRVLDALRAEIPADAWRARAACATATSRRYLMQFAGDSASGQSALAVSLAREAGDTVSLLYATMLLDQLQTIGWSQGDFHDKRRVYAEATTVLERLGLGSSVPAMRVATLLSSFARETGRLLVADSALAALRPYLDAGERWRAATPALLLEQAQVAAMLARPDDARQWFARAIELTRAPGTELLAIRARQLRAQFLAEQGDLRQARADYDTLGQLLARSSNSAFEAARVRTRAALLAAEGQAPRAAGVIDSLLRARGYPGDVRLVSWSDVILELAQYETRAGRHAAARTAIERVRTAYAGDSVSANGVYRLAVMQLLDARMQSAERDVGARQTAGEAVRTLTVALGPTHPLTVAAIALRDSAMAVR